MATATAPQRTARPAPAPEVESRPDLRVVDGVDERPGRRSLAGLVGTFAVVLLFVCLFGVVVFQVLLVQSQSRLDDLDRSLATQESRSKALDLQMADLESPDRIVAAAQGLGMISPDDVVYLEPTSDDDAQATYDPATEKVGTVQQPAAADPATAAGSASATTGATATTGAAGTTTATTTPSSGAVLPPGPPYTAENNWGAGGPPTTPPVYNAANNWGAGPTTAPTGGR